MRRALLAVVAGLALWVAAALGLRAAGAQAVPAAAADAVVVLGCGVAADGSAGPCLRRRTEAAVALWQEGRAPRLLLTGGVGRYPPAEGVVAAELARSLGVPDEALVVEQDATSTWQNAQLGMALLEGSRVILVTDRSHAWRAQRCFAAEGAEVSALAVTGSTLEQVWSGLREVLAVFAYAARGRCR